MNIFYGFNKKLSIRLQGKLFIAKIDLKNFSSLSNDNSEKEILNALKIKRKIILNLTCFGMELKFIVRPVNFNVGLLKKESQICHFLQKCKYQGSLVDYCSQSPK